MSLLSEGTAIVNQARSLVNQALAGEIAEMAKNEIAYMVESAVYPRYTPTEYVRRGTAGGIADRDMYEVTPGDLTLTVSDNRREVGVVESGVGYTWEGSLIYRLQPFPRPYFAQAEQNTAEDAEPMIQQILSSI